jgi:hypothetical protein
MSDMAMDGRNGAPYDAGSGGTKGAAVMAMILWVVVAVGLFYGLFNTIKTAADLFGG